MHVDCESTAYSVETVYEGKGHLYTPSVCPVLLATSRLVSLATSRCFTGDHPVDDAQPATPC
jgi:hypothetical protein